MKMAIMQPYFFPYIGYFQLINSVDRFIFYDDVNFIKNGWINRNRILLNNQPHYITVQLNGASSYKLIKDIKFTDNRPKLKKTIEQAYKKAPYFNIVWPIIENCLDLKTELISELAIYSVIHSCKYLNIKPCFEISSKIYPETENLERTDRLMEICRLNNASQYINPIGGTELYNKDDFIRKGMQLNFIRSKKITYNQNNQQFVEWLSIIDVMMFNSVEMIKTMLNEYELI